MLRFESSMAINVPEGFPDHSPVIAAFWLLVAAAAKASAGISPSSAKEFQGMNSPSKHSGRVAQMQINHCD